MNVSRHLQIPQNHVFKDMPKEVQIVIEIIRLNAQDGQSDRRINKNALLSGPNRRLGPNLRRPGIDILNDIELFQCFDIVCKCIIGNVVMCLDLGKNIIISDLYNSFCFAKIICI